MTLLLKNLLFTVLVPGTVAVYLPLLLSQDRPPASGPLLGLALAVLLAGAAIYAWCVWDFATFGRATPLPIDAPKRLVVRGLYRYTRNPMYMGVLTVIVGWAIFFRASDLVVYALAVGACFHLFVVAYEERHLAREFGSEYEAYCSQVARWLPHSGVGTTRGPGEEARVPDPRAPSEVVSEYFARMRGRDLRVVELFHDDAELIGLGTRRRGRAAIREFYTGVIERAGPTPRQLGPFLSDGERVAAEILIELPGGAKVHAVDLFEVEQGLIRSLTYFIASE